MIRLSKNEFLAKYPVTKEAFDKADIPWSELVAIYDDHEKRMQDLLDTGTMISQKLSRIPEVHSLRVRAKNPEHLIEKIIRKSTPERKINYSNYTREITDLVGVRALHLFKHNWLTIHERIGEMWELVDQPVANIRKGDIAPYYDEMRCKIVEHDAGYRSVHYLVSSSQTKIPVITEIQVRTIFEEGWSEIDHQMRYPYNLKDSLLNHFLAILNRLAGSADEMGSFITMLIKDMRTKEARIQGSEAAVYRMIDDLHEVKRKFEASDKENRMLQDVIETLQRQAAVEGLDRMPEDWMDRAEREWRESEGPELPFPDEDVYYLTCERCGVHYGSESMDSNPGICPLCEARI